MEIDHYMLVLPKRSRHLLKHCLYLVETKKDLSQSHYDTLTRLIARLPYPTLQILQLIGGKPKYFLEKIVIDALHHLLKVDVDQFSLQFISFLVNFPIRILANTSLCYKLPQILARPSTSDEVYISLLCRSETKLLDDVLVYLLKQWKNCDCYPTKEYALYQALNNRQHFIPSISAQINDFKCIKNIAIRNNLLILKISNEFSNTQQTLSELGNISRWFDDFEVLKLPDDLKEIHEFFCADFKRIFTMIEFLKQHTEKFNDIKVEAVLNTCGILKVLYEYEIVTSFQDAFTIMETIYKLQHPISSAKSVRDIELETFTYYAALSIVFDVIVTNIIVNKEQYYSSQMHQLNVMMRHIRNMDVLCSLIEDMFRLVFLRWEHLCGESSSTSSSRMKAKRSDSAVSTDDEERTKLLPIRSTITEISASNRNGFVCRGQALHTLFLFLKNFVTKKLHTEDYRDASEYIQLRFQKIIDIVNEALWKYSVLEKIDNSLFRAGVHPQHMLEAEEMLQLVQFHVNTFEKSSSDDDSRDRPNFISFTRRKTSKKKRRATFSGALVTRNGTTINLNKYKARASLMVSSVSEVQGTSDPVIQLKARNMVTHFIDRGIVPKMLGSPENLAIMALGLNSFNNAKHIIETFKLKNTELNRELLFVEQQQQVKQKLASIYANYAMQESAANVTNQKKPKATVEQIKNVAGKGFEVSKIINVIENFAKAQKINQRHDLKQLLNKYRNVYKYSFLQQFDEDHLKTIIITDLILNLPFNREIAVNIVIDIKRQQLNAGLLAGTTLKGDSPIRSELPREIGAMHLLENLTECMRLLDNISLQNLLNDNYYSLRPRQLSLEFQREHAFQNVFYKKFKEVDQSQDLKNHSLLFHNLQSKCKYYLRFSTYTMHLVKLVRLRDPNLEYHTSELLKIDPYTIIGELIFDCDMTPLEIESNVSALNLNLIHVIALSICPEIIGHCTEMPRNISDQKLESISNYISNQNQLLAYLLQCINQANLIETQSNMNSKYLNNLQLLDEIHQLSALYKKNTFITALRSDYLEIEGLRGLQSRLDQLHILLLQMGTKASRNTQANHIDEMIVSLIKEDKRNIALASHLHDIHLRAKLLQSNFTKISTTRLAKELIESTLHHKHAASQIPHHLLKQLEITLADITIYAKVSEVMQFETWPQAYDFGLKTPNTIFQKLLSMHLYKLCYKWCKVVNLAERFNQDKKLFLAILLDALLELGDDPENMEMNKYLLQILETFSIEDCVRFLESHKDKFRSIELMEYTIDFLDKNNNPSDIYLNYKVSLIIFKNLDPDERFQFWNLFKHPLLIIEQLIMNAKFEILTKVLDAVRKFMQQLGKRSNMCSLCFDKRGNMYDIHTKGLSSPRKQGFQLDADAKNSSNSAFILLNFNLYQSDHIITNECIDLLLRMYSTKALDYYISDVNSSSDLTSQTDDMQQSLDSLCGAFQMPKEVPSRSDWVRDEEATHCMCCRRAAFTMLMRRHHCRRCGRVVCFACSTHRMRIPELYDEVEVRICNDCHSITEEVQQRKVTQHAADGEREGLSNNIKKQIPASVFKWKLSGNITHDKVVREEFCYDHAPSVALCLSILSFHLGQQKCVELLLYHCRKLEKLIVPNPEVDYELVAKMMNCLALAAKVRGGPAEVETIREHSEIILSVVQNGCASFIPPGPLNNHSLRKLADCLVQAENWELALEVHLKCGFSTTGVMAAHGLSCLRAGCFDTAREKFSHCMPKLSNELVNTHIFKEILCSPSSTYEHSNTNGKQLHIPHIKRPQRGPPLLQEILKLIESTPISRPQPETLQRASIIRNSNSSLASIITRRKDLYAMPLQEPALNVLTTLANLKHISKGQYSEATLDSKNQQLRRVSRGFEESMHYVLTYGSHVDVIRFLMRYDEHNAVLKYILIQNLEPEYFIQHVFLVMLHQGQLPLLIVQMQSFDEHLLIWRNILLQTCRFLEAQNLLNSLYQLQILLKDPVRASMTCVKFYTMNSENFQQLHANAEHLHNAKKHLQSELEIAQWENINLDTLQVQRKHSITSRRSSTTSTPSNFNATSFLMQMDARSLNTHINTILKQLEVTKFLAKCEKDISGSEELITHKYLRLMGTDVAKVSLPTLFDNPQNKLKICILILLCGKNIDEGFGLAYSIIQDYKLQPLKVYAATAKYLAESGRLGEVEKFINSITSNNGISTRDIDEVLSVAINSATNTHEPGVKAILDVLTRRIHNVELRISSHLFIGQLKSAYLLANKHERLMDIRRIMRQAELTNQIHIKKLCERKLNMQTIGSDAQ